ncbi:lysylphosphatidylglycerol synthase transmembrane domain-containing protein [Actinoplanes sp. CA-252034]|uniref:lysylphosphatidylglycerol synthase transmembrane domain-containing protein n=1 Tax=Actinoplanes sp. CA-252034 TaxID=3239906 RepID=UPI003D98297A
MTSILESTARGRPGVSRRWLRVALFPLAGVAAVVALRGRLPDLGAVAGILLGAGPWWTAVAGGAALLSQAAFAVQQRRLLGGLGVELPHGRALALTVSRSAMSMTLPAGSAVSAAFAFRVYRRHGASGAVAAVVTAVSGLLSVAALGLLYGAGWLVANPGNAGPVVVGGALGVPLLGWILRSQRDRIASPARRIASRWPAFGLAARGLRDLPRRSWLGALRAAVVNWLLDMLCLAAAAAACGADLGWGRLALIYLAVQVVRQVPLTPGGVGLIEASMLAGLTAAGMPDATAAAVVLLYRLVSFWLMLPLGLVGWLRLRREDGTLRESRALSGG